jgi:hypothetical protein
MSLLSFRCRNFKALAFVSGCSNFEWSGSGSEKLGDREVAPLPYAGHLLVMQYQPNKVHIGAVQE